MMNTDTLAALATLATRLSPYHSDMVAFAQRLVQTPSLSGEERAAAALVATEMARLSYDKVWTDRAGNVIGLVKGADSSRSIMLNAHLDHVPAGDESAWKHAPYAAEIVDGELWGRASVDLKGSVAAMVYGMGALRREGIRPPWDVYVAAVVLEEVGGMGTETVLEQIRPEYCVIGEATKNQLSLGHRGAVSTIVEITGRAAHASMVDLGINPHFSAARFILGISELKHESDAMLGPSTVAPTLYQTDQTVGNVIPGLVRLYLDWRSVPTEDPAAIRGQVNALLQRSLQPGTTGAIVARQYTGGTYTGIAFAKSGTLPAVKLEATNTIATRSRQALQQALGRHVDFMVWRFCSDGAVCAEAGIPMIGFGPGDPELAHTSEERVSLRDLQEAMVGNAALALSPGV